MSEVQPLLDGLSFGESLRWHQDRLWLADWGAQEVLAIDREGQPEVMARVDFPAFPMCIDWLPDGRLLVVAARDERLLRQEPDGSLVAHADLNGLAATRRILQTSPHIAILVVTMFDDDSVFAAMQAGARGYLLKGAEPEATLSAIRSVGEKIEVVRPMCMSTPIRKQPMTLTASVP